MKYFFAGFCSHRLIYTIIRFHVGVKLKVMCSAFPLGLTMITFDEEAVAADSDDMTKITTLSSLFSTE